MPLTIVLATVFVSLAGFNVWSMLTGRAVASRSGAPWFNALNAHRAAGYAFIALYVVLCFVMLRRASGSSEPWPPSVALHAGLAFSLAPLLLAPSRILQESFGGAVATRTEQPVSQLGALRVTLSRSGRTCGVGRDQTVLEGLERNGVFIPSGCRTGRCGTCATKLRGGHVQMDGAEALSSELRDQGFILPCVSRPLDDITLDA